MVNIQGTDGEPMVNGRKGKGKEPGPGEAPSCHRLHASDIKSGMLLQGSAGQVREVLAVTCTAACRRASFRQICMGNVRSKGAKIPQVGEVHSIGLDYLVWWTVQEVTDPTALAAILVKATPKGCAPDIASPLSPCTPLNDEIRSQRVQP